MKHGIYSIVGQFFEKSFREEFTRFGLPEKYYLSFWIKFIWDFSIYGASVEDFFVYKFYEKKHYCKSNYVTLRNSIWMIHVLNKNGRRELVEDKTIFIKEFKDYISREALDSTKMNYQNLEEFIEKYGKAIAKPAGGFNGNGIFIIDKENVQQSYNIIKKNKFVVEEVLQQDGILRKLNPKTVNTIRVNVINKGGKVCIVNAILRSGQGDSVTDNICAGGIVAEVDIKTGIVFTCFYDLNGKCCIKHPLTGTVMLGEKIPVWENVKNTAIECAKRIDNVVYTSWDIAVISGNKVAVIEGNTSGNFNIQQVARKEGIKYLYRKKLKEFSSKKYHF